MRPSTQEDSRAFIHGSFLLSPPITELALGRYNQNSILTFQVSDEGDGLDGITSVGEGLDHVVLHDAQHAEASLVTYSR